MVSTRSGVSQQTTPWSVRTGPGLDIRGASNLCCVQHTNVSNSRLVQRAGDFVRLDSSRLLDGANRDCLHLIWQRQESGMGCRVRAASRGTMVLHRQHSPVGEGILSGGIGNLGSQTFKVCATRTRARRCESALAFPEEPRRKLNGATSALPGDHGRDARVTKQRRARCPRPGQRELGRVKSIPRESLRRLVASRLTSASATRRVVEPEKTQSVCPTRA